VTIRTRKMIADTKTTVKISPAIRKIGNEPCVKSFCLFFSLCTPIAADNTLFITSIIDGVDIDTSSEKQ
jgi:hypothetical protein